MNIIEYAIARKLAGGGSALAVIEPLSVTTNGTYNPPDGVDGYSPVTVSVARDDQTDIEEQWIRAIERDESKPVTELPAGLTKIGSLAFYLDDSLALTSLPDGLKSIGGSAFSGCSNLALTSLPDGLTSIGSYAFSRCSNLALTSLPDGVTTIANCGFNNCTSLTEITFRRKPVVLKSTAFSGCTNIHTINVPWEEGAVAYAPWGATNATVNYNYTGG